MGSDAKRISSLSSSPSPKTSKFSVYRNPSLAAAWTANSLRPSRSFLFFVSAFFGASAFSLISCISREKRLIDALTLQSLSQGNAYAVAKVLQGALTVLCIGTVTALVKGISLHRARFTAGAEVNLSSRETKDEFSLSNRQLELLGIKSKANPMKVFESPKRPSKSKPPLSSEPLVPIHQTVTGSAHKSMVGGEKLSSRSVNQSSPYNTPSKTAGSPSFYLVPSSGSPAASTRASSGQDKAVSSPWSAKLGSVKGIATEEQLEQLLAEVDEKMLTPSPTIGSYGMASPSLVGGSASASGTTRSTPLRPVRMSPGTQKFTTPPKKGEGEFPTPMSLEEAIDGFKRLGVYPQIEHWRDRLRQWVSSVLLKPLLKKVESSHIQVMQSAARLGVTLTVSQVGSDLPNNGTTSSMIPIDQFKGWQSTYSLDEDSLLHQLRASLVQAIDSSMQKLRSENQQQLMQQQQQQEAAMIPIMQECVDAITEHQRLQALMKGEWVKGLLPRSNIPTDYTVQRIRELAEGTCVKSYEYNGRGEAREKNKKWSMEVPTDSHLLLYLFCAYLEHPKWMLHLDPSTYTGTQASKNPLFLGILPPKERFPENYVAVVSGVPSTLHPGACVLAADKQSPSTFALYWDKKLQFTLQGRTALWDSILMLCHRINTGYGGVVRGMTLSSSALNILQVLDSDTDD